MDYLSLHSSSAVYNKLHLVWSVCVDTGCNKRGQTSRSVVRTEIQTSCNFKANLHDRYYLLDCVHCLLNNAILESPSSIMLWYHSYISLSSYLDLFLHKNFLHPPSSSNSNTRAFSTIEPR